MVLVAESSLTADGAIAELEKLRITGTATELRLFALKLMDAAVDEKGKAKAQCGPTKVRIKRVDDDDWRAG